jgi:hypothetical protein
MGFEVAGDHFSKRLTEGDYDYLRGGWLEERLFLAVQAALPQATDVQLGVKAQNPGGSKNEFDVLFTLDNILVLVECKSLGAAAGHEDQVGGTINDFLYKLGALRQQFGLTPQAFLATTAREVLDDQGQVKITW